MAPVGRPPHPRHVSSLEELVLPDSLLLDTSFVVAALVSRQPYHEDCATFLERAADANVQLFFNRLLEIELLETAYKIALKERWGGSNWTRRRLDGRARRRATRLVGDLLDAWGTALSAFTWIRVELEEVVELTPELMSQFPLQSYDAVHVATALYADVTHVATLDQGFALVPADLLHLHVAPSLVPRCRSLRK